MSRALPPTPGAGKARESRPRSLRGRPRGLSAQAFPQRVQILPTRVRCGATVMPLGAQLPLQGGGGDDGAPLCGMRATDNHVYKAQTPTGIPYFTSVPTLGTRDQRGPHK